MTKQAVQKLPLGLYRIFWKSGGSSLAAVGNDYAGKRWFAPVNWIGFKVKTYHHGLTAQGSTAPDSDWRSVSQVELIAAN
jgi:hypothetical protein